MVEALCRHVSDESPTVRRLCLNGLVQIPPGHKTLYTPQVLVVILALLEDSDESVQLTAVSCLLMVLDSSPNDAVQPLLLNLSVRLRSLQVAMNAKMRSSAFAAFGALSDYGLGAQDDSFLEQVHTVIPRLILHLHDDDLSVRLACRNTLTQIGPLTELEGIAAQLSTHSFNSDHQYAEAEANLLNVNLDCISTLLYIWEIYGRQKKKGHRMILRASGVKEFSEDV